MQNPSTIHKNPIKTLILLLLIGFLLLVFHLSEQITTIKKIMFYVLSPSATSACAVINISTKSFEGIKTVVLARQENVELKEIVQKHIGSWVDIEKLREENNRLRELLGFKNQRENSVLCAQVLSRDCDSWFQWITINKGSKDGVLRDVAVLAIANSQPCVLGRVYEVFENSSKIILVTNPLFSVPAKLENGNADALIEGLNDGYLTARFLKNGATTVNLGDNILTSSLSSVFPKGFKIGTVNSIKEGLEEPTLVAHVKPAIDLNFVSEVIILLPKEEKTKNLNANLPITK